MKQSRKRRIWQGVSAVLIPAMTVGMLSGIPDGDRTVGTTDAVIPGHVQAAGNTELHNPRTDGDGNMTWDCVYFGSYPQSDATGQTKEPIKWRVLSVDGDDAFLVADRNLDVQCYNDTDEDVTWETCTMRSWLNGYGSSSNVCEKDYTDDNFIDRAFNSAEQNAIRKTDVVNADNPYFGTSGGNTTQDKIFLLSYDEVTNADYGFSSDHEKWDNARERANTAYVAAGGTIGVDGMNLRGDADLWWLRSPGSDSNGAMYVYPDAYFHWYGQNVHIRDRAVCPALHLNLSSSDLWSYAGTVSSDGSSTDGENPPSGEDTQEPTTDEPMPPTTTEESTMEKPTTESPTTGEDTEAAATFGNPRIDSDGIVTWDCVWFGRYPQSDATGQTKEPIKWRVLSVDGDDAFLVADRNLDVQSYNAPGEDVTWETCTMRSWLNGYGSSSNVCEKDYTDDNFIDRAFNSAEQNAIRKTDVVNADNSYYGTSGGNTTQDKIFLLSYDEVTNADYRFSSSSAYGTYDYARKRTNTAYVAAGGTTGNGGMTYEGGPDAWWLRSPGNYSDYAMVVGYSSYVDQAGVYVDKFSGVAVCPALYLNLSSSNLWSYAGTVSSDGSSTDGENPPSGEDTEEPTTSAATEEPTTPTTEKETQLTTTEKETAATTTTEKETQPTTTEKETAIPPTTEKETQPTTTEKETAATTTTEKETQPTTTEKETATPTTTEKETQPTTTEKETAVPATTEKAPQPSTPATTEKAAVYTTTEQSKPDNPTKLNISNKKTYKTSKKVTVKDADGIKTIKLNSKTIKVKNGKKSYSFKLSTYKKYLKKKGKWNKLVVADLNGKKKTIQFKTK